MKQWGRVRAGRGIGSTAHILTILGTDTCGTGGTEDRKRAGGEGEKIPACLRGNSTHGLGHLITAKK